MSTMRHQHTTRFGGVVVITTTSIMMLVFVATAVVNYTKCATLQTSTAALTAASYQLQSSTAAPARVETHTVVCEPCSSSTGALDQGGLSNAAVARAASKVWGYESPITDLQTMHKHAKAFAVLPDYTFPAAGADMVSFWHGLAPHFHAYNHFGNNGMFDECDGAVLHAFVRHIKPQRVFEVGSGFSTAVVSQALRQNAAAGATKAKHLCVEPYRADVVRSQGINVDIVERPIQEVDLSLFDELQRGDLLFLDNSHVIKPYGDVIFELLWVLPRLKPGVYVHLHDILLPYDYITRWMVDDLRQYTEQYMLAAFLYGNAHWKVVFHNGHLNNTAGHVLSVMDESSKQQYLSRCAYDQVAQRAVATPASIYLQRL